MGQCLAICCPSSETVSDTASETQPILAGGNANGRLGIDEEYPRDDESSKLDKIVRDTAGAFVDINSEDIGHTTSREFRDKESMYQSALATQPQDQSRAKLPDCGSDDPEEVFSKTSVTVQELQQIAEDAQKADQALDIRIKTAENLVEVFDNTPKN